ncbi:glycogen debranching protein [Flindersiella endophytica]
MHTPTSPAGVPPQGATYDGSGTTFALWAPAADRVEVCLFDQAGNQTRHDLPDRLHGVWHGYLPGVGPGQEYGFRAFGSWDPQTGHRFNPSKLLVDPYARAITGDLVDNEAIFGYALSTGNDTMPDYRDSAGYVPKSVVVAPEPIGDHPRPRVPWDHTVLYELHPRGHTMRHPKVPPELRGTYAGLAHPAVVDDLADLGVTTIELLPIHHFLSETWLRGNGLTNYWGYNTLGFFAPHAAYSASGSHGEQVREFQAMVRAFHAAGVEVVLDVVYNHTCEHNEFGPTVSYRGIHNAAYYRLLDGGRRYVNTTGTGNTVNLSHPQAVRLTLDSLRYWVEEMGVDGFRFDLATTFARDRELQIDMVTPVLVAIGQDPVLSKVKLIAEPWDIGLDGYQAGAFPAPWSEWNGKYRDDVRDFWRGMSSGLADLGFRLSGSSDLFGRGGRRPFSSVNFVTCHDGFTLRDLVSYDHKHNEANREQNRDGTDDNRSWNCGEEGETDDPLVLALRRRQARNLLATLLLSIGVPMLLAGDERGRTQGGNNNAFCQDNEISWTDWEGGRDWLELRDFVKELLRLRREHPVLRRGHFFTGAFDSGRHIDVGWFTAAGTPLDAEAWHDPWRRTLGMFLVGEHTGEYSIEAGGNQELSDDSFLLWLNADPEPITATLPGPPWALAYSRVLDTSFEVEGDRFRALDRIVLPARSVVLLRAERVPGHDEPHGAASS